jgi:ABC-type lipoprotein export system ATPase subunit
VFGILREIAGQGRTVIVVTHDAGLAARADRRIQIVDGKIAQETWLAKPGPATQPGQELHAVEPS